MEKETAWINIRPGVAVQIEYDRVDHHMAVTGDDEVPAKLTGQVRITRDRIFDSEFLTDPMTGQETP